MYGRCQVEPLPWLALVPESRLSYFRCYIWIASGFSAPRWQSGRFCWYAEHDRQLGGVSPLHILIEEK